jgi:hypothetical protein
MPEFSAGPLRPKHCGGTDLYESLVPLLSHLSTLRAPLKSCCGTGKKLEVPDSTLLVCSSASSHGVPGRYPNLTLEVASGINDRRVARYGTLLSSARVERSAHGALLRARDYKAILRAILRGSWRGGSTIILC